MTTSTQPDISESQIQLLVDGELDDHDRAELLAAIDKQPERWRDVALAFVEVQLLDRELAAWNVAESSPTPVATAQPTGSIDGPRLQRRSFRNTANVGVLTLAAIALAVTAFVAKQNGQPASGIANGEHSLKQIAKEFPEQIGVESNGVSNVAAIDKGNEAKQKPFRLQLINHDGRPIDLPVLSEDQFEGVLLDLQQAESPVQTQSLHRYGYQLNTATRLVAHDLENGQQLIVPVREFSVSYHGQ